MALVAAPGCGFNTNPAKPGTDAGPGVDGSGGGGDDGGPIDTPPGNQVCYGPDGWKVCLNAAASGQVQLQGALDTGKDKDPCLKNTPTSWTDTQPDACIIVGDTVTVASLNVTGSRPLAIVAQTRINVTGLLDVASHRATGAVGAGSASVGDCKPSGNSPASGPPGGGGAGGSFMFQGGNGGPGDGTMKAGGQAATADVGAPTRLRGGCAGQPGGGGVRGDGGAGGGAVYLVSANEISIQGTIDVSGAGGAGQDSQDGAGGGGSGGMMVLFAPSVMTMQSTILIADGGGGGGGSTARDLSGQTIKGDDGHEPVLVTSIAPALGGAGGIDLNGFNGGDGGNGYPASSNMVPGLNGQTGDTGAGGGGGGGGGGYIRSNQGLGSAAVSPAADIKP